jgi:hypothetical protein
MARSNVTGRLWSSDSLHDIPSPLPPFLHDGLSGLSALCEMSCGQSLSTYCICCLSSNDIRSLYSFIPALFRLVFVLVQFLAPISLDHTTSGQAYLHPCSGGGMIAGTLNATAVAAMLSGSWILCGRPLTSDKAAERHVEGDCLLREILCGAVSAHAYRRKPS